MMGDHSLKYIIIIIIIIIIIAWFSPPCEILWRIVWFYLSYGS